MDYNKLLIFLRVCEAGGFTKAAKNLFRSQSAVSQQIQLLEQDLNLTLILRKKRTIQITPEGIALYNVLKESFFAIENQINELTDRTNSVTGECRIGVLADFGSERAVKIVSPMKNAFPNINLRLVFKNNSQEIESALNIGELDFGIVIFIQNQTNYKSHELYKIQHIIVGSPKYLLEKKISKVTDLAKADLIDYTQDFTSFSTWLKMKSSRHAEALHNKKPLAIVPNHSAILSLVHAGLGLGLLQKRFCSSEIDKGELVQIFQDIAPLDVTIHLIYHKQRRLRNFESKIIEFLLEN